jgi:2,4-dienoyl-CoA reductase-like NADH-dependent reductase (Old Yellow Enzyme family)
MSARLEHLFSPITLGPTTLRNRIVSTGHHSYLADKQPGDALIAYHEARARGGVGLIVTEIIAVHESAGFSRQLLSFESPQAVDAYRRLAEACQRHGCRVFAQLFHPGREILSSWSGLAPVAWAPSAVPNERFHIMPKAMPVSLIEEVVAGFGRCAAGLAAAGFDGVEIVGSHGYLPAQFLSPAVNRRDDAYGGDFERRLKFLRDTIATIRRAAPALTLGLRLSGADHEPEGLDQAATADICAALEEDLDYLSLVLGSSATLGASVHITPAMGFPSAYVAEQVQGIRAGFTRPLMVTGRINQPQLAEQIIASGQADLCGMTRALICDPELPNKAASGALDAIRACIGCNQACIGRAHKGLPISCIQYPESGRELELGEAIATALRKRVIVVGAGPAGLKAAAVAAARGHEVHLYEKNPRAGGQALLAQTLPGRDEFGGIVDNLLREVHAAGVEPVYKRELGADAIRALAADAVILATGAGPYLPDLAIDPGFSVNYEDVLSGRRQVGSSVVIADWRADWIGIGLAERFARDGCRVTLAVNAAMAGESLQIYTRNHYVARLYQLGVDILPHARLYGSDAGTVYLQNTLTDAAMVLEGIDTLVLSLGQQAYNPLETALQERGMSPLVIGDCLLPRTAEEAVYEGLLAGRAV